jgi:hypothetical protein
MVLLAGRGVDQWAKQPHCSFRRGANTNDYAVFVLCLRWPAFHALCRMLLTTPWLASSCTWAECLGGTTPPYRITNSATVHSQALKTSVLVLSLWLCEVHEVST